LLFNSKWFKKAKEIYNDERFTTKVGIVSVYSEIEATPSYKYRFNDDIFRGKMMLINRNLYKEMTYMGWFKNNVKAPNEYVNYIEYANKTFGNPLVINAFNDLFNGLDINSDYSEKKFLTIQSVLNNFIQYDNIKFAMERTKIGVIKPNPYLALQGVLTTNINNFDNTDSKLGLITNYVYANTLKNSAHFNTIRQTKYITPSVYDLFGNKLHTIFNLRKHSVSHSLVTCRLCMDTVCSKQGFVCCIISNIHTTFGVQI
jgi:hypothetical protein